jgi:hypothetical protein
VYARDGMEIGSNMGRYDNPTTALLAFEAFDDPENVLDGRRL